LVVEWEADALSRAAIPPLGDLIMASRQESLTVGTEGYAEDLASVQKRFAEELTRFRLPQQGTIVLSSGQDPFAIAAERNSPDPVLVEKSSVEPAGLGTPEPCSPLRLRLVAAPRQDGLAVWTESHGHDCVVMA
jgi:hypothetical protein